MRAHCTAHLHAVLSLPRRKSIVPSPTPGLELQEPAWLLDACSGHASCVLACRAFLLWCWHVRRRYSDPIAAFSLALQSFPNPVTLLQLPVMAAMLPWRCLW